MLRGSVLSYDWYKSGEGQGLLAHLTHPATGLRRLYGYLEYPGIPPSIECIEYKLFLLGDGGAGKSAVTAWLAGISAWNRQAGESPGLRVTTVYWPAKIHKNILLFKLNIWDCGEGAVKKYGHLFPACKEGALGVLPVFSCTDRSSWQDVPDLLQRFIQPTDTITPIVIANRYTSDMEGPAVTLQEMADFEKSRGIPVVTVRNQTNGNSPPSIPEVAPALNTICEQLYIASNRSKPSVNV